jgi:ABC-2 type transport system permease protein
MTDLTPTRWTTAQTREQFFAIARLRWRITANSLRRKGGKGELLASLLIYPLLALLAVLPTLAVGGFAWYFAANNQLGHIYWLCWATFGLCQLLNIQLGQASTTFDPTQLIRFPMHVRTYTAVRLFFGMLSPANIVGTLMCFAIALGVTIAQPSLFLYAFLALAIFAAANILFTRMVFAWIDRWLATRRAREIFTGITFLFVLGIQYVNFAFNPAYNHGHKSRHHLSALLPYLHRAGPYLRFLPPELTNRSLLAAAQHQPTTFFAATAGCALYAAVFLAVFTVRMRTEFRGENFSDAANAPATKRIPKPTSATSAKPSATTAFNASPERTFGLPPTSIAQFGKEFLFVRRNQGVLFALIMPMAIAVFLCIKWSTRSAGAWVFPAAVAYTLMGLVQLSYNSWGLEGAGSQMYFLAPVRIRDIMLGKNLLNFALAAAEVLAMFGVVLYTGNIPSLSTVVGSVLWASGTILFSTAVGNQRSLASPKKIILSSANRKQTSPLSGLISLGVMMVAISIGAGVFLPAIFFHLNWIVVPVLAAYAFGGFIVYSRILGSIDRFALIHRESLFLELCKPD